MKKDKHANVPATEIEQPSIEDSLDSGSWLKAAAAAPARPPRPVLLPGEGTASTQPPGAKTPSGGDFAQSEAALSRGAGRYEIQRELARGGMGRILKAHDKKLARPVILKELLHPGASKSEERFMREALLTAKLEHPSIVPVHDLDIQENGAPYYAMKLVDGESLDKVIARTKTLAERIALLPHLIAVCEAVAYAHAKGIIHRDVKPHNVLLGPFGETVVIDWGLAKEKGRGERGEGRGGSQGESAYVPGPPSNKFAARSEKSRLRGTSREPAPEFIRGLRAPEELPGASPREDPARSGPSPLSPLPSSLPEGPYRQAGEQAALTKAGDVLGTPAYMPPEQAEGREVDARADVYALGAILYHLLSGAPPYEGENSRQILKKLAEAEPRPLEERAPGAPRELLAIAKKAMSRAPRFRYPSASDLAADLKKFQTGQLVGAHPYSSLELLKRFLRRHRTTLGITLAAVAALAVVVGVSIGRVVKSRQQARQSQQEAVLQRDAAQRSNALAAARVEELTFVQARAAVETDPTLALAWLKELSPDSPYQGAARLIAQEAHRRGVAQVLLGHTGHVYAARFSPDGKTLASGGLDGAIRLWNVETGEGRVIEESSFLTGKGENLDFLPDGTLLAVTEEGVKRFSADGEEQEILSILETKDGPALPGVQQTEVSSDGRFLALSLHESQKGSVGTTTILLWDLATGERRSLTGQPGSPQSLKFSPDGRFLASAADMILKPGSPPEKAQVWLWDLSTGEKRVFLGSEVLLRDVELSPDGTRLAAASGQSIQMWDLVTGEEQVWESETLVHDLAFSPDGAFLASASDDAVRLWNMNGMAKVFRGHSDRVTRVIFSPDGASLASASRDKSVRLWNVESGTARVLSGHRAPVEDLVFSPDGKFLASASEDKSARLWKLSDDASGRIISTEGDFLEGDAAFSPDGKILAHIKRAKAPNFLDPKNLSVQLLDGVTGEKLRELSCPQGAPMGIAFSPDGKRLASTRSWKLSGRRADVCLWDVATGEVAVLRGHDPEEGKDVSFVRDAAFSPDGKFLGSAGSDSVVRLWDLTSGEARELLGHEASVNELAFSPDGKLLASASEDGTTRLWNLTSGEARVFSGDEAPVKIVAFSPDGGTLVSASEESVRFWEISGGEARVLTRLDGSPEKIALWGAGRFGSLLAFSLDGETLATGSDDFGIRLFGLASGKVRVLRGHQGGVHRLSFSSDGARLLSVASDPSIRLWDLRSGESQTFPGHRPLTTNAILSPDGARLVSTGGMGEVRLWSLALPVDAAGFLAWLEGATNAVIGPEGHLQAR